MSGVELISIADVPHVAISRWDMVGTQVNRHVASTARTGTPDVLADVVVFPPGFMHRMHKHPGADQFMLVLSGAVIFEGIPREPITVGAGKLLVIPRGEWHEVSNQGDVECEVFHFFGGAGCMEDVGFEPWESQEIVEQKYGVKS